MNRDFCIHDKLFLDNLAEIIDLANRTQKDEYVDLDALKGTLYISFSWPHNLSSFIFHAKQSTGRSQHTFLYVGNEASWRNELQSDDPNLWA